MAETSIKNKILELGFTPHEAEVYLTLLPKGTTTAGPLISETKLHRNIVYTALDHLLGKKLVSEKLVRGKKHFSPSSPNILAEEFNHKAELAAEVVKTLKKQMQQTSQEITIHQGNEEYLTLLTDIIKSLPKGATKYVVGTGGEAFMQNTMRPIWKKYHQVARQQKIRIRMLGYEPQRPSFQSEVEAEGIYKVRFLPAHQENPAGVHIYPEAETILNIIYSDEHTPVTAIKIKNRALAQGYLTLFHNLWQSAKI